MKTNSDGRRPAAWAVLEKQPLPKNIPYLLDSATEAHPDRSFWNAIEGDAESLTYAEFTALTLECAAGLQGLGVRKGTHVALMLPNSVAFLASWIALCRLGAVAVMVNTASTGVELSRMVGTTDAAFLIIDKTLIDTYKRVAGEVAISPKNVIVVGADDGDFGDHTNWSALTKCDAGSFEVDSVEADDIASIQFTSGSSGVPKACMLSHRYWLTLGKSRSAVGPTPARMLIDSPMFYMGPLWRIMLAIYSGASLYVAGKYSLSRLFDRIIDNKIDFCSVTYPVAKLDPDPRLANSSLTWLTTYGLSKELHVGLENRFGVPVREIYGMTEVGSVLSMPVNDFSMVGSGSCGVPAPFRRCKIMVDGNEAVDGASGELWVSGPGLFSGYYKNPEATSASFEGEWFKTGDLFRRDSNGYYFMMGRIKDVIRRSGENISAAEIELAIDAIEGVLEVAAIPVKDAFRGEEVKVVIARAPTELGKRLSPDGILRACRETLAPFKVPRYVQFVEALPKTPTGKIDKNVLKAEVGDSGEIYDANA